MSDTQTSAAPALKTSSKRNRKLRAAWISFAGRIVAQIVGAAATVAFAIVVFHTPSAASHSPAAAPHLTPQAAPAVRDGVAVLPFTIASEQPGQAFLARSLTHLLAATLVGRGEMRVISASSAARYLEAASALNDDAVMGAEFIIEGTVTVAAGHARITIMLTDLTSNVVRWARSFEGSTADLLTLERGIAETASADVARVVQDARNPDAPQPAIIVRR